MQTFKNNMADSERAENIKSISADDLSRCVDEIKNIFGVDKLSTNQFDQRRLDSRSQSIMGIERLIPRVAYIDC